MDSQILLYDKPKRRNIVYVGGKMAKYRKKPVVVDAWQWNGETLGDAIEFSKKNGLPQFPVGSDGDMTGLVIDTLEGKHIASKGDYIIRGIHGEYYPCKPDIFEKTYEKVK